LDSEQDKRLGRRELLRGIVRGVGLAGVAAVAAMLGRRALLRGAESCDRKGICRGCGQVQLCALPQAMSFREAGKEFNAAQRVAGAKTAEDAEKKRGEGI